MKHFLPLAVPWAALLLLVGPALAGPTNTQAWPAPPPPAKAGSAGRGSFQPSQELPIRNYPQDIALADVDGDGDLDLLAANYAASTVSVRLNGGDASGSNTGYFAGGTEVAVGSAPYSLVVSDIDHDGDLDLLTGSDSADQVSVRLNGGDARGAGKGVFGGGSELAIAGCNTPLSLALADVDGDSDPDLLVATNCGTGRVHVRLNGSDASGSATGRFGGGSTVAVGSDPYSLALADVDSDGDLDLLTANYSSGSSVSVRLNGGDASGSRTGCFGGGAEVAVGAGSVDLALADIDGDGDPDLLTANYAAGTVSVRLNGGAAGSLRAGQFGGGTEVAVGSYPRRVALADVDGDGDLDLLAACAGPGTVSVRLNGGEASGAPPGHFVGTTEVAVGPRPSRLALADIDGDGDPDLLTASAYASGVSVRLNQPPPSEMQAFSAAPAGPLAVLLAWTTSAELRCQRFDVERSTDSLAFGRVGELAARGSAGASNAYALTDGQLPAGQRKLYYRLRQLNQDGATAYSAVRAVVVPALPASLLVQAWPNPTPQALTLTIQTDQAGLATAQLTDALGRLLSQRTLALLPGATTQPLPELAALPGGVYLLRVRQGSQQQVLKLVRE